jgi:signal transduction histidine kinase
MTQRSEPEEPRRSERRGAVRNAWSWSGGLVPLALVVVALLGSVLIPARQTWLITNLLRETTEAIAPSRVTSAQLQSGLAEEMGTLQSYALSGDGLWLRRHDAVVADNDRRLAALDSLGSRVSGPFKSHVATARERVAVWRLSNRVPIKRGDDRRELARALQRGQRQYDASKVAVADLSSDLSTEAALRNERVRALEHFGLASNATMVLAAFVALSAVLALTLRERRLATSLRRRVEEESTRARREEALREAAQALAGTFTIDEVTQEIARAALEALEGRGAFVERIVGIPSDPTADLTVTAVAGSGVPPVGTTCRLVGSYAERVLAEDQPVLIPALSNGRHPGVLGTLDDPAGATIAIPLGSGTTPVGALFVTSATGHFRAEDVESAAVFGHLAVLAYAKVKLLEEAIEGRQRLQRVMTSRSRLMRGFSHDVKNPIGAADGYAELLDEGIYGELSSKQRECIARMRRCMRGALALIDDLHELSRAETGHLELAPEQVDVPDLVRRLGEEYQATAETSGLRLVVSAETDIPSIQTSRTRVRQIVSNLLSNAIKYTDAGSVTLKVLHHPVALGDGSGEWVLIEVADTGRGIPPDKLDYIFQEFGRVAGTEKQGAGLGLAISRLLAQALGGRITVSSEIGRGSTFILWLPSCLQGAEGC